MEYYVAYIDCNSDKIEYYNIFNHAIVNKDIAAFKKRWHRGNLTRDDLIYELNRTFMYCFWSKCEWEMMVSDLFDGAKPTKVDVYDQLKLNIAIIADMLIIEWEQLGNKIGNKLGTSQEDFSKDYD